MDIPDFIKMEGHTATKTIAGLAIAGLSTISPTSREGRLYASDAGACARKAVLSATSNDMILNNPASNAYYGIGNAIEELLIKGLTKSDAILFSQYRLPPVGINMGGYIDAIVIVNGKIRVLEIKSCGKLPNGPKPAHTSQAAIYSAITGLPATLLYMSRSVANATGALQLAEFELESYHSVKRDAVYSAVLADVCVKRGVVPHKPYTMTEEKMCDEIYCPFTAICWHGQKLPVTYPEVSVEDNPLVIKEATELTDKIMDPLATQQRRSGVLKYIQMNGTPLAKTILAGDWSSYF